MVANNINRKPRRRNTRRRGAATSRLEMPYTELIVNPCKAVLVPGLYGTSEGLLARVRSTISKLGAGQDTAGYVLWCPDYCNVGGTLGGGANLFLWKANASSTQPVNISTGLPGTAVVYGGKKASDFADETPLATAASGPDPAYQLLQEELVQDVRTLSACMSVTYTGKMLDASGQICTLTNIPLSAILSGGTGAGALSVDDCFRYSNNLTRFSVEGTEVLSRPTQESHHFRDEEDSPIRVGTNEEGQGGEPPPPQATSSTTDIGEAQQPTFIGFAWRGLDAAATNPLVFDFTKNQDRSKARKCDVAIKQSTIVILTTLVLF